MAIVFNPYDKTRPTRYKELGTLKCDTCYRIVDRSTMAVIGPLYKTKIELLADLNHFAAERGYS